MNGIDIKATAAALSRRLRLDSHHEIERFGVVFTILACLGVIVFAVSGAAAFERSRNLLASKALYTADFTTSKTLLDGEVDGVYVNRARDVALVMMHFDPEARISHTATDYRAFLLGSDENLSTDPVQTPEVHGSLYVFGSTGYLGVLLRSSKPFESQILNLTVRANAELSFTDQQESGAGADELAGDVTFRRFDQWRVFLNPGASDTTTISALDAEGFNPAKAFYQVITRNQEAHARGALDAKLLEMRADLSQISAYSDDLATTRVGNLSLRPPTVPPIVARDEVTGASSAESDTGRSSLRLVTRSVVPGGFDLDWRAGTVYDSYLDEVVPDGQSYVTYLAAKQAEATDADTQSQITGIDWILSDGTDLTGDYATSEVAMRPLTSVMNSLSQAYQAYYTHKREYQEALTLDLLALDIDLRDVESNTTEHDGRGFLVVYQ